MVTTLWNPDMQYVRYSDESGIRVSGFRMVTVQNFERKNLPDLEKLHISLLWECS